MQLKGAMKKPRFLAVVSVMLLAILVSSLAEGKRGPPPRVEPIAYEGVLYKASCGPAPGDGGSRDYTIEAWDDGAQKKLWDVVVYRVKFKRGLELDVQEDFIAKMEIVDGKLLVTSERGKAFSVDLSTHRVTRRGGKIR